MPDRRLPFDQAATLRRLFPARGPSLLPVLVAGANGAAGPARAELLAAFAQALARVHGATVAIDAARLQLAAAFDVALRRDLADVIDGDAPLAAAVAAVAPRLRVAAATRALERQRPAPLMLDRLLGAVGLDVDDCAWMLAVIAARASGCLRSVVRAHGGGEAVVPVSPDGRGIDAALSAIRTGRTLADIRVFRLLFLGMDRAGAVTLFDRMAAMRPAAPDIELRYGEALAGRADAERVAQVAASWDLMRAGPIRAGAELESVT